MSRYAYQSHFVDGNGSVVLSGTVTVYLTGTSTLATIYDAESGGTAITNSQITTSTTDGSFKFFVDTANYYSDQEFRIVLSKTNYSTITYDDIKIFPSDTIEIATLAKLKAYTGTKTVFMKGRTSDLDGGQGTFVWNSSDLSTEVTADTLSGIYVPPNTDNTGASGAWVRQYQTTLYPEWFGAFPDGTTDYGVELQAALTAMPVGTEMVFSDGVYVTSTHLLFQGSRTYRGVTRVGTGSAIKQDNSSDITDGILVSSGYASSATSPDEPVIIRDLIILGNKANNAGAATAGILSTNYDSLIDNVLVYQTKGDGIRFDSTSVTSGAVGNRIRNTIVRQADGDGIDIDFRYTDGVIDSCEFGSSAEYGINNQAAGWVMKGNNIYDAGLSGILAGVGWNTIISNNIVDGWGQSATTGDHSGIWMSKLYDGMSNTISGNSITMKTADIVAVTNYIGIRVNPLSTATAAQCSVTGNSIAISATATTSEGIRWAGSGGSGKLLVTGNITQNIDATKEIVDGTGAGMNDVFHSGNSFDKTFQALAGSGTASVLYGSNFETGDTNIVYTNFTNGFDGQTININFAYAPGNGYVDFTGSNLKGNGGVDWYFSLGDSMTCTYDGTNWYCNISPSYGVAIYDFSVDGGSQGVIELAPFPDNATITEAYYEVITPFTSGGAATVAFGVQTVDATGLIAATAFDNAAYGAGYHDFVPNGTAANFTTKSNSVDLNILMTIAGADLTAGKVYIWYNFVVSE